MFFPSIGVLSKKTILRKILASCCGRYSLSFFLRNSYHAVSFVCNETLVSIWVNPLLGGAPCCPEHPHGRWKVISTDGCQWVCQGWELLFPLNCDFSLSQHLNGCITNTCWRSISMFRGGEDCHLDPAHCGTRAPSWGWHGEAGLDVCLPDLLSRRVFGGADKGDQASCSHWKCGVTDITCNPAKDK